MVLIVPLIIIGALVSAILVSYSKQLSAQKSAQRSGTAAQPVAPLRFDRQPEPPGEGEHTPLAPSGEGRAALDAEAAADECRSVGLPVSEAMQLHRVQRRAGSVQASRSGSAGIRLSPQSLREAVILGEVLGSRGGRRRRR